MKSIKLCLLLPLITLPILVNGAAYIKFDGVDGESIDKDHKGWIDVLSLSVRSSDHKGWSDLPSFSQGRAQRDAASGRATGRRDAASGLPTGKRDAASGLPTGKRDAASGMATGKRQHEPIKITKPIDKATPLLAQALSNGNSIGNVTIQRTEGGKMETLILTNVTVAAINGESRTEEVTFNYEKIGPGNPPRAQVRGWDPKKKQPIKAKEKANRTK